MASIRVSISIAASVVLFAAVAVPVGQSAPKEPKAAKARRDTEGSKLTDAQVVESMKKGIEFLLTHKNGEGNWDANIGEEAQHKGGATGLVLYALMHAGLSLDDDPMAIRLKPRADEIAPVVKYLAGVDCIGTYSVGLQANALTVFKHNNDTLPALKRDHDYLVKAMGAKGGYHYHYFENSNMAGFEFGNVSCAQYGALGAWALADDGIELPLSYWKTTDAFFRKIQLTDGAWPYIPEGRFDGQHNQKESMTTAGLATLYVAQEFLDTEIRLEPKVDKAMNDGLAKVVADFDPTIKNMYYLYGVERVGLASGRKFFGDVDWYREGAANIINSQREDGHFDSDFTGTTPVVATAYALLFLARGRNPVAFNKLEYNGPWNARPRDDANITRWMSKQFERPINWQSVNLNVDPDEWTDAPVLLITGSRDPHFTDAEIAKLRRFVSGGGTIFSTSDGASGAFTEACTRAGVKMVDRQYEFRVLPPEHPIFGSDQWTKINNAPRVLGLSNGIRDIWIHSTADLGASWQGQKFATKEHFDLPANIYFYAAGRSMLHSKLRTLAVADAKENATRTIAVGRLQYAGNWDPEPGAWTRFGKIAASTFNTKLDISAVKPADLDPAKFPIVHMVGTATTTFGADEAAKMKDYITGGGTLFIDCGGGSVKFAGSVENLVKLISPGAPLEQISSDDALLAGKITDAVDSSKIDVRRAAIKALGNMDNPKLMGLKLNGRWAIIFSPLDITSGFFSTNTGGIVGYTPESSQNLARDIVLYAAQPKTAASAQ